MGKFTVIPQNTFQGLQLDAGVLLRRFDPSNPVAPADSDIICATTGGINVSCVPTYSDLGEDVDNVPVNMMELRHLDTWACTLSTTSLGTTPELIKLALGAADIDGTDKSKIIPRADIKMSDFTDLWWVGDRADGGMVAVKVINALSTGGFVLQTTKNGKGTVAIVITGHVALSDQKKVPMEFYSADPAEETIYSVSQTISHITSSWTDTTIAAGENFSATLTPDSGYTIGSCTVSMGGVDITSTAYNNGVVTINNVSGSIAITAVGVEITTPSVSLDKSSLSLTNVSDTGSLTATTVPTGAEVVWTSSDDSIASVENGLVTAVAAGNATITATITVDDTEYTATCSVTVGGV